MAQGLAQGNPSLQVKASRVVLMEEPAALVVASPSVSPDIKRQRTNNDTQQDLDAEAELAAMLAVRDDTHEFENQALEEAGAPKWAIALQSNIQGQIQKNEHQLQRYHELMLSFHGRLQSLEKSQNYSEMDARVKRLEQLVADLSSAPSIAPRGPGSPEGRSENFNQVPPPQSVRTNLPSPPPSVPMSANGLQTDYCHIIVGGWEDGSGRKEILTSAKAVIDLHDPSLDIVDLDVRGKRSQVCHLLLSPLPQSAAFDRYINLRRQLHEKHRVSSAPDSLLMWFTASKPQPARQKNRRSLRAQQMLQEYLTSISSQLEVDTEWGKGIIWIHKSRAAASDPADLRATVGDKIISISTDSKQPDHPFHFNVSRISKLTEAEESHVEKGLYARQ